MVNVFTKEFLHFGLGEKWAIGVFDDPLVLLCWERETDRGRILLQVSRLW